MLNSLKSIGSLRLGRQRRGAFAHDRQAQIGVAIVELAVQRHAIQRHAVPLQAGDLGLTRENRMVARPGQRRVQPAQPGDAVGELFDDADVVERKVRRADAAG